MQASSRRVHFPRSLAMLIQILLILLLLSIGSLVSSNSCLRNSLMSSSHLFRGLPIALLVLYLGLSSGFQQPFSASCRFVKWRFSVPVSMSFFFVSCSKHAIHPMFMRHAPFIQMTCLQTTNHTRKARSKVQKKKKASTNAEERPMERSAQLHTDDNALYCNQTSPTRWPKAP